jgi:hypothetical protein
MLILADADDSCAFHLFDILSLTQQFSWCLPEPPLDIKISADDRFILFAMPDQKIEVWELTSKFPPLPRETQG